MGVSLVRYRNQLRLERFVKIMDAGRSNMLEAARAAGFGSYAQFHRVFHSLRGTTPRAYLGRKGEREGARVGACPLLSDQVLPPRLTGRRSVVTFRGP